MLSVLMAIADLRHDTRLYFPQVRRSMQQVLTLLTCWLGVLGDRDVAVVLLGARLASGRSGVREALAGG